MVQGRLNLIVHSCTITARYFLQDYSDCKINVILFVCVLFSPRIWRVMFAEICQNEQTRLSHVNAKQNHPNNNLLMNLCPVISVKYVYRNRHRQVSQSTPSFCSSVSGYTVMETDVIFRGKKCLGWLACHQDLRCILHWHICVYV